MDYLIGALVIWAVVSLPMGILLGTLFNRMDAAPRSVEHEKRPTPFPMFTYVGPAPVMPVERADYEDDEPPERLN